MSGGMCQRQRNADVWIILHALRSGAGRHGDLRRNEVWRVLSHGQDPVQRRVHRHRNGLQHVLPDGHAHLYRSMPIEYQRERVRDVVRPVSCPDRRNASNLQRNDVRLPMHDRLPPLPNGVRTRRRSDVVRNDLPGLPHRSERHGQVRRRGMHTDVRPGFPFV